MDAAKAYYTTFKMLQEEAEKKSGSYKCLRVATIFSFAANEEQSAIGDITDESFDTSAMNSSAKEFLDAAIDDYNACFKTNFSTDSNGFQNYGTVAKLAMRQPFVLFKGLTFQKLCLPGAFRPGDHHNKMLRPGLCVVHASPQYL